MVLLRNFSFGPWHLTLTCEDEWALPFKFKLDGFKSGTNETWCRRYISMKEVFLHILNRFNENANIKSQYTPLNEALRVNLEPKKKKDL